MDKLEHFIINNREQFNDVEPPAGLWDKIDKELPKDSQSNQESKIRPLRFWMSIAAAGVVLFFAGIGFSSFWGQSSTDEYAALPQGLKYEFEQAEQYYQQQVSLKLNEIDDQEQKDNVLQDLNQLDEVYDEMRGELLSANGLDNEVVVREMINNYRTKLDILEKVLNKIDKSENSNGIKIKENERIKI